MHAAFEKHILAYIAQSCVDNEVQQCTLTQAKSSSTDSTNLSHGRGGTISVLRTAL